MEYLEISDLPPASSLTGAEIVPIKQAGNAKKASLDMLATLAPGGPPGEPGEPGDPGPPGEDGASILYGTTTPSSGLGANGDLYLDTIAGRLYGPKASGSWGSGISLIGPPGTGDGTPGEGVPTGGTTGQVLAKNSGTDYDTEWIPPPAGGGGGGSWTLVVDDPGTSLTNFTQRGGGTVTIDNNAIQVLGSGTPMELYYNAATMPLTHAVLQADIMLLGSNGGDCFAGIGAFDVNDDIGGAPWHGYAPFVRIQRTGGVFRCLAGRINADVAARPLAGGAVDTWFTVQMHLFGGAGDSYVNGVIATPSRGTGEWRADSIMLWGYGADAKWRNIKVWVADPGLPA